MSPPQRHQIHEQARQRNPRRWSRSTRCWRQPEVVFDQSTTSGRRIQTILDGGCWACVNWNEFSESVGWFKFQFAQEDLLSIESLLS